MMLRVVLCFLTGCGVARAQDGAPDPAAAPAPASLDWNDRWQNYVERTYSWQRIALVAADAAFGQTFQLKKCGRPPYCFPNDFGAALSRRTARTTVELGVGALLHEDLRRPPSGLTGFRRRFVYAMVHAPLARGADGEWRPAYSRFAGSMAGIAVASAYRGRPVGAPCMAEGIGWSFAAYFQDALMAEFEPDMKRMARKVAGKVGLGIPGLR